MLPAKHWCVASFASAVFSAHRMRIHTLVTCTCICVYIYTYRHVYICKLPLPGYTITGEGCTKRILMAWGGSFKGAWVGLELISKQGPKWE